MDIRILPGNIANLIAAGEVVQRPASVVKELVENAVDAHATQITVSVTDAGRTLIQVTDNGCGMSPDDAVVCFERHATSKISSAEDLGSILTYGFRGEALASIAAVAEVTLRTRTADAPTGCQVVFDDSRHVSTEEIACPCGTTFAVRNLFYNVPARRKFLKSDNVELKHIIEEFTRVALIHPETGFTLTHNGKDIFVLRPAKSEKFRIRDLLGAQAVDAVVDISADTSVVGVNGYVCRPDLARKTTGNQFFFVNGRYFRSPYLHKAVMKAYEGLVADGAVPSYFIFLSTDPHSVDVNIHPTKTEIKFEDDSVIFQVLYACVKEALGRNSFGSAIDFDVKDAPEIPVFGSSFDRFHPEISIPEMGSDPDYDPFAEMHAAGQEAPAAGYAPKSPQAYAPHYGEYADAGRDEGTGKLFEDRTLPSTAVIILDGRYIVTKARSGLLMVNVSRARERILYERFLKAVSANAHVSQMPLFPVQVTVGAENRLIFEEHSELLSSLGFDISPFGTDTIVVNGVPEGYSCDQSRVEALMADVLLALDGDHSSLASKMDSAMAAKFARMGSTGSVSSSQEAQKLIDSLFSCSEPEITPGGNRTMNIILLDEIDRKFDNKQHSL
ncbi:MAG: DNA mismatch repair endonuclease MutL [Candidatus Cryptobacteroides sp.]|nr:DNA mismatch repair endonuclease MutL [Bacteroidales bacterium]